MIGNSDMHHLSELKHLSILFVDDDEIFSRTTIKTLEMLFAHVYYAKNGKEALDVYDKHSVHMVMLDIRMGDISGIEVAQEIRKKDSKIPMFIASSYTQTDELIIACGLHLVGYLVKPFTYEQLEKILFTCLGQLKDLRVMRITFDDTIFYDPYQKVIVNNEMIFKLTSSEIIVLEFLSTHKGNVISYTELLNLLGDDASQMALKNIICRLRKKIGDKYIENLSKLGYKLV